MRDEKESRETMDTGYSKWRKLDNAALAFPLVTGKDDTRVFRFYCQLKEKVDGEILQSALDQAMEKYPLSEKRSVLVLSGAQKSESRCKTGDRAAMQPFVYSG